MTVFLSHYLLQQAADRLQLPLLRSVHPRFRSYYVREKDDKAIAKIVMSVLWLISLPRAITPGPLGGHSESKYLLGLFLREKISSLISIQVFYEKKKNKQKQTKTKTKTIIKKTREVFLIEKEMKWSEIKWIRRQWYDSQLTSKKTKLQFLLFQICNLEAEREFQ